MEMITTITTRMIATGMITMRRLKRDDYNAVQVCVSIYIWLSYKLASPTTESPSGYPTEHRRWLTRGFAGSILLDRSALSSTGAQIRPLPHEHCSFSV